MSARSDGEFISRCHVEDLRNIIRRDCPVEISIVWILVSSSKGSAQQACPAADQTVLGLVNRVNQLSEQY